MKCYCHSEFKMRMDFYFLFFSGKLGKTFIKSLVVLVSLRSKISYHLHKQRRQHSCRVQKKEGVSMRFFFCLAFSVLNLKANTTKKQLDKQGLAFYGVIIGLVYFLRLFICLEGEISVQEGSQRIRCYIRGKV